MGYKNFREVYHKLAIVLDNGYCYDTLCMTDKTKPELPMKVNSALVYGCYLFFNTLNDHWSPAFIYFANKGVERYLSPVSGNRTAMRASLGICFASSAAAWSAAPEVIPTRSPSVVAKV